MVEAWYGRWVGMPCRDIEERGGGSDNRSGGASTNAAANGGFEKGQGAPAEVGEILTPAGGDKKKWLYLYQFADGQRAFLHPVKAFRKITRNHLYFCYCFSFLRRIFVYFFVSFDILSMHTLTVSLYLLRSLGQSLKTIEAQCEVPPPRKRPPQHRSTATAAFAF